MVLTHTKKVYWVPMVCISISFVYNYILILLFKRRQAVFGDKSKELTERINYAFESVLEVL